MRNLFYIEMVPFGLRANLGASPNSPVMIYFTKLSRETYSMYITFYDDRDNVVGCLHIERFCKIDREILSCLNFEKMYDIDYLLHLYRYYGRELRICRRIE